MDFIDGVIQVGQQVNVPVTMQGGSVTPLKGMLDSENSPFGLSPLPPVLRHGLAAVATFGFLSFFSSTALFVLLMYKLVKWQFNPQANNAEFGTERQPDSPAISDVNGFLVPDDHLCPPARNEPAPVDEGFWERLRNNPPNQFLVLIINLLLADIQQAIAFMLNVAWLTKDAIAVGTPTCWAQGWFVSTGDLASSVFITSIAAHTYLGVVQGYRLPTWAFYTAIVLAWAFVYLTAVLGVVITDNGAETGGLYVRAGAWCWINSAYQDLRLHLHYLWIFLSLALTSIIYTIIFLHIQSLIRKAGRVPENNGRPGTPDSVDTANLKDLPPIPAYARQQTFLLYPLIYVLCTVPLAAGRIASMAGNQVSLAYFCFAGSMIACNGWLDVLLYSTTRRSIVFSSDRPGQDTGIDTFAFMRTPPTRKYGNVVIVSGGQDPEGKGRRWNKWSEKAIRSAGRLGKLKTEKNASSSSLQGFGMGQGAVMGMAIQCETTTSVSVEVEDDKATIGSRKNSVASNHSNRSNHTTRSRTLTG